MHFVFGNLYCLSNGWDKKAIAVTQVFGIYKTALTALWNSSLIAAIHTREDPLQEVGSSAIHGWVGFGLTARSSPRCRSNNIPFTITFAVEGSTRITLNVIISTLKRDIFRRWFHKNLNKQLTQKLRVLKCKRILDL